MRIKNTGFAAILALLASNQTHASPGSDVAAEDSAANKAILAQEHKYTQGVLTGDVKLLETVFAPTFVDTSSSGAFRTREEMLQLFKRMTPPKNVEERNRRVQIYGTSAVVTVEFIAKGMDGGKPYSFRGRATDVWELEDGIWLCVAAHSSAIR